MKKENIEWLDTAKGIAISLVVLGHVLRGLSDASGKGKDWVVFVDSWIYTFHMPVFFIISGLLIQDSAAKPMSDFLAGRIRTVLYPYFVWSIIQEVLRAAVGFTRLSELWRIVYEPVMQFWFLYVLMLLSVVYAVMVRCRLTALIYCIFTLALYILPNIGVNIGPWGVLYIVALNGIYFAFGTIFILSQVSSRLQSYRTSRLILFALFVYVLLAIVLFISPKPCWQITPFLGFSGAAATFALANALHRLRIFGPFLGWGKLSLEIYVAHTIFSAGIRVLLERLNVTDTMVHIFAGFAAGIAGPIALAALLRHMKVANVFTLSRNIR